MNGSNHRPSGSNLRATIVHNIKERSCPMISSVCDLYRRSLVLGRGLLFHYYVPRRSWVSFWRGALVHLRAG